MIPIIIAVVIVWLLYPRVKPIQQQECTKHIWERNSEDRLYCIKCNKRPG